MENCKHHLTELLEDKVEESDFLSLDQSDLLIIKFYDSYKNSSNKLCKKYTVGDENLSIAIKNCRMEFSNTEGYLIIKQTETCGLIKVPVDKILDKYLDVIKLDGDSLCLLSTDESMGIYIDYFEEVKEDGSVWYLEICFWKI